MNSTQIILIVNFILFIPLFIQVHITDPTKDPLPKSERYKYKVNYSLYSNDDQLYTETDVALPMDTDDVILKFTTSTNVNQIDSIQVMITFCWGVCQWQR